MARKSKRVITLVITLFLLSGNMLCARAEALPEVLSGSTTLADNIMSYYALSGAGVANTEWINTLYNSYGSNFGTVEELANQGYLVLNDAGVWTATQELGEMIEQAPAYTSLGLNEIFNVSAEEAAAGGGFAAASGGSILAGSLGGVASSGILPLLGGVTAAYWGGIALGTLAAHLLGLYDEPVYNGVPMTKAEIMKAVGASSAFMEYPDNLYIRYDVQKTNLELWFAEYSENNVIKDTVVVYSPTVTNGRIVTAGGYIRNNYIPTSTQNTTLENHYGTAGTFNKGNGYEFFPVFRISNSLTLNSYLSGLRNNTIERPTRRSPDLIGENGNLQGQKNNEGQITVPDIKPQIDPGTQAGVPLSLSDWLNFANGVQNNNNQSPDPSGNNASLFSDILDLIKTSNPNVNPDPNPDPDPWSPPVVNPVPDPTYPDPVPDQPPSESENPEESENPQESERPLDPVDTGRPWMLPDLTKKFPFCIPWDIADCFTLLKSNIRQAPHISWTFNPPNTPVNYTFNLDLSYYEPVATLLRSLELIAFIVGLAFVTRYLIGAS